MTPFLLGLSPSVEDSALLSTESAYQRAGENTGNLAFCYAINRLMGGNLQSVMWDADPAAIDAMGQVGILPLANQLGAHADLGGLVPNFRQLDCAMVGMGLGAQADNLHQEVDIPQGTLDWVRAIQDHSPTDAPNITVRGKFTLRALEKYGLADKAVALGCPTLFISPDKSLGKTIARRFDGAPKYIAVASGHQSWTHLSRIEASLVQIAASNHGAYICQSPIEMVRLGRGECAILSKEVRDICRNYVAPHLNDDEFVSWCNRHAYSFFSADAWLEHIRRFDFVIGTRIHGVMLALQAGVPALCIVHDSRTRELCETMKVPHVAASDVSGGLKRDDIGRLFKFDPDEFDAHRASLASGYRNFMLGNGLTPAPYLANLAALVNGAAK